MPDDEVGVFMNGLRIMLARDVLHHDVIAVTRTGVVGGGEFVNAVRPELLLAAKRDDPDRHLRRLFPGTRLLEKGANLLEILDCFTSFTLAGTGIHLEVGRGDAEPGVRGTQREGEQDHQCERPHGSILAGMPIVAKPGMYNVPMREIALIAL